MEISGYCFEKSYQSFYNAEFLNNNRLTQEDDMMSQLPLRICYDPSYEFEIQNRQTLLIRDDELNGKKNCNKWHIFRKVYEIYANIIRPSPFGHRMPFSDGWS